MPPDPAASPAPLSRAARVGVVALLAALTFSLAPAAEAQKPVRIGATTAQTGTTSTESQGQLRGYQLCVKHLNDKGGVLGRKVELLVYDDGADPATAARLYEKLITQDRVDLVLGPYGSGPTDAVADVTEKHRMPMIAPVGSAASIYGKGRRFVFGMPPPSGRSHEGTIDLAAKKGLKTVALLYADMLFGQEATRGARELARKKGLQVVAAEPYPRGATDLSAVMTKVQAANPDLLLGSTLLGDAVAIIRGLKALNVNPRMVGLAGGGVDLVYAAVGRDAEFVYSNAVWLPDLVDIRAGGLIPIARQYPGAREFVESYRKAFPGAELDYASALGYGGCQILAESIRRAGSLDGDRLRDTILKMDYNTVAGAFQVDRTGLQVGHRNVVFQWQDGKKAIVWPEELAPGPPRFPTPPWTQRP